MSSPARGGDVMPYIWIVLVVFFGVQDEVFIVAAVTLWSWLIMWANEELRVVEERIFPFDSRFVWMAEDEQSGEEKP